MKKGYKIFCESCDTDSYIEQIKPAKFCPACGSEIEDTNIDEEDNFDGVDDEWDKLVDEVMRDDDEWE